jgi:hypothetical protein
MSHTQIRTAANVSINITCLKLIMINCPNCSLFHDLPTIKSSAWGMGHDLCKNRV